MLTLSSANETHLWSDEKRKIIDIFQALNKYFWNYSLINYNLTIFYFHILIIFTFYVNDSILSLSVIVICSLINRSAVRIRYHTGNAGYTTWRGVYRCTPQATGHDYLAKRLLLPSPSCSPCNQLLVLVFTHLIACSVLEVFP